MRHKWPKYAKIGPEKNVHLAVFSFVSVFIALKSHSF